MTKAKNKFVDALLDTPRCFELLCYDIRREVINPLKELVYIVTAPVTERIGWILLAIALASPFALVGCTLKQAVDSALHPQAAITQQINADAMRVVAAESNKEAADPFGNVQ